jgi:hypothetical protein
MIGTLGKGSGQVIDEDFKSCISQCLDLELPSETINTKSGTILFDQRFQDKVYLAGFLREQTRETKFKFGYNLAQKLPNGNGDIWKNPKALAMLFAEIWAEAIKEDETAAAKYLLMLQN